MIWQLPKQAPSSQGSDALRVSATSVLRGHQARLWDAKFVGDLLVSASEDCTCRCAQSVTHILANSDRGIYWQLVPAEWLKDTVFLQPLRTPRVWSHGYRACAEQSLLSKFT